ncbi:MAG: hypothetical protein HY744_01730 [Deltaproteobacteria bacterium]|nr:hypothetical protein [Deltaproteobacteria bacterium]
MHASCAKRCASSGTVAICSCMSFSARFFSVESCCATYTSPIPPEASRRSTQ